MRNDVDIPPADLDAIDFPPPKTVSKTPIHAAPGHLKADVTLFDHPDLQSSGAGNFWPLAIVGLMIAGVAVLLFWVFFK